MNKRLTLLLVALSLPAALLADPLDYPVFPRAELIDSSADESPQAYTFVLSAVEKIRRELKIEDQLPIVAKRRSRTYLLPRDTSVDVARAHYEGLIEADAVRFKCRGRDCGRSNQWANQVFGSAILYGPDAQQSYIAGEAQGELVAVYVIQRGNRRTYAHLVAYQSDKGFAVTPNQRLVQALTGNGHVIVRDVIPTRTGALGAEAVQTLGDIGESLASVRSDDVYVVCHLYAPGDVSAVIERAQQCAEAAVAALSQRTQTRFLPFAAGPMMPRGAENHARIELVMPHRQNRD